MRRQRREVVGVVIHVVAATDLARAAVAAPIMRDDAEAVTLEEKHLRIPVIGRKGPAMAEDDGLSRTPILVENLDTVLRGDRRHDIDPSRCLLKAMSPTACSGARRSSGSPKWGNARRPGGS